MHSTHSLLVSFPPDLSFMHEWEESRHLCCAFGEGELSSLQRREPRSLPFRSWQRQWIHVHPSWPSLCFFALWLLETSARTNYLKRGCLIVRVGVRFKISPSLCCSFLGRVTTNNIKVPFTSLLPNGLLPKIKFFQMQKYILGSETKLISGDTKKISKHYL